MNRDDVKRVIQKRCIDAFGKKAVIDWDLDKIAEALLKGAERYKVEPELALAQGILECHFGCNPAAKRSRKTRNIFNVGNVDDGRNRFFASYEAGIDVYFRLMAREYRWPGEGEVVSVEMMERHDFRRPRGGRYATAPSYTRDVVKLAADIRQGFPQIAQIDAQMARIDGLDSRLRGNDKGSGNDNEGDVAKSVAKTEKKGSKK